MKFITIVTDIQLVLNYKFNILDLRLIFASDFLYCTVHKHTHTHVHKHTHGHKHTWTQTPRKSGKHTCSLRCISVFIPIFMFCPNWKLKL